MNRKAKVTVVLIGVGTVALLFGDVIVRSVTDDVRLSRVREDFGAIRSEVENYKERAGCYPTAEQGLDALVSRPILGPIPERWERSMKVVPIDAWGNKYRYRLLPEEDRRGFEIISMGPDGMLGNKDDFSTSD